MSQIEEVNSILQCFQMIHGSAKPERKVINDET